MSSNRKPIELGGGEGRTYVLGKKEDVTVTFKADGEEVAGGYAVTEWVMEKGAPGLDPHVHEQNDELIHVLEGEATVLLGDEWTPHTTGAFIVIPAGTVHAFRNDSQATMRILNILVGASYEAMMPQITALFVSKG